MQPTASRRGFLKSALALSVAAVPALRAADQRAPQFIESLCNFLRLPCGRRLAYSECGDPRGRDVIINHHGVPNCRLDVLFHRDAIRARPGLRVYTLDRPGFGLSDPDPEGTFLSWPADVMALADALRLERFGVMGVSGGGPYALAVARAVPDRVIAVSLACPMAPLEAVDTSHSKGAQGARFALRHPLLARVALAEYASALRNHPDRLPRLARSVGPADFAFLDDPVERGYIVESMHRAFDQGVAGVARGAAHLALPWACWLKDVRPKVTIFQGCNDRIVSPAMARYLAAALPHAEAHFYPGEGHVSISRRCAADLLAAALQAG